MKKVPFTDEEQTEQITKLFTKWSSVTPPIKVKALIQRLQKHKLDMWCLKFLEAIKKLHINVPFADALIQMLSNAKFLKDILSKKMQNGRT